jgi:RNA polymerase sigma-70 factor (ECF subfamily)
LHRPGFSTLCFLTGRQKEKAGVVCQDDFSEFYRREIGPLVAFVCRAGHGWHQACDAAQEAMVRAYVAWSELRQPRAWLRTIAPRIAATEAARCDKGVQRAVAGGWLDSAHTDPETAILDYEQEQLLMDLAALPERQRLVMAWALDGFDHNEISGQLEMSRATVRSNLRHARNALKAVYLKRKLGEEGCDEK